MTGVRRAESSRRANWKCRLPLGAYARFVRVRERMARAAGGYDYLRSRWGRHGTVDHLSLSRHRETNYS